VQIFITGAGGFVGSHLISYLLAQPDFALHAGVYDPTGSAPDLDPSVAQYSLDLRSADAVHDVLDTVRPDIIIHLAAMADVGQSFRNPWGTLENNILAQVNVLQALVRLKLNSRVLVVSSAEIYGAVGGEPLDENTPFRPNNPYSVSKVAQDMMGLQYYLSHKLPVVCVRPFNHIGPGQRTGFVAADFASQIAAIEAGQQPPVMKVGNLQAERDFTDVRDVVRAYHLLAEHGQPGEAYNIASGTARSVQYLLDTLLGFSTADIEVQPDPDRMRPSDVPRRVGDATKLQQATGWQPNIPFEQTLLDILNDWRERVRLAPDQSQE
jgi:GDP-4-dehydro-6-deoxy-D-mannose reductase